MPPAHIELWLAAEQGSVDRHDLSSLCAIVKVRSVHKALQNTRISCVSGTRASHCMSGLLKVVYALQQISVAHRIHSIHHHVVI